MNQFKLEMFYLLMLRMVHQDCLDPELVQLLLDTKRIQVEEAISVQKATSIHGPVCKYDLNC